MIFKRFRKAKEAAEGDAAEAAELQAEAPSAEPEAPAVMAPTAEEYEAAKEAHRRGDIDGAERVYAATFAAQPENSDACHMLAVVAMQRGQLETAEAGFTRAIALNDTRADYHNNLGNCLTAQGRVAESVACFRQAVNLDGAHLSVLVNLSTAEAQLGNPGAAELAARRVLELVPDEPRALLNLGAALTARRELQEAITVLRKALQVIPGDVRVMTALANALEMYNELDDALEVIQLAERAAPDNAGVVMTAGVIFRRLGFAEQAVEYLQRAVELGLGTDERAETFHQLGLAEEDQGNAEGAMQAFAASNALMAQRIDGVQVDPQRFLEEIQALRSFFTAEKFQALLQTAGDAAWQPVFFVGFPRSGTTLMEQILRAHRQIVTTEETSPLAAVLHEVRTHASGYPAALDDLNAQDWARLRQSFRDFITHTVGEVGDRTVVDKLPLNIVHLGLAKLLFPRARIVLALRDPRDVCLSCFAQKFELNDAMANFLELDSTLHCYRQVMGLVRHYEEALGLEIFRYRYEDLVENLEVTVTGLLQHIGLDWDITIEGYREQARNNAIATPSYRDVTGELTDRAVARWQRYPDLVAATDSLQEELHYLGY